MRVAIFICAVLAFAALSQEGSAKTLKKKQRVKSLQESGTIILLPPFSKNDPIWIHLVQVIKDNIDDSVYVYAVLLEQFNWTADVKYIIVMNNQEGETLYVLSVVRAVDGSWLSADRSISVTLNDDESSNKKE